MCVGAQKYFFKELLLIALEAFLDYLETLVRLPFFFSFPTQAVFKELLVVTSK